MPKKKIKLDTKKEFDKFLDETCDLLLESLLALPDKNKKRQDIQDRQDHKKDRLRLRLRLRKNGERLEA